MSEKLTSTTSESSDAALISAVRAGDLDAYGDLFSRHRDAANRLARQLVPGPDADDLVSEAFVRVMAVLQAGKGPDEFFRAYLLTSIRRLHIDRIRSAKRVRSTDDEAELDRAVEFVDPAEMKFEQQAAATAFASLPERWQLVLWHLDVEGQKPAQIAPLLGMSANSVSALAYRAREGLRLAYLQGHLAPPLDDNCRWTTAHLGQYVRKALSKRDTATVDEHLETCSRCTALYLDLAEVNSNLSGLLAPALLGTAAAGYLASGSTVAALGFFGQLGHWVAWPFKAATTSAPVAATVAAGIAVVAVGAFAVSQVVNDDDPKASVPPVASTRSADPAPSTAVPEPTQSSTTSKPTPSTALPTSPFTPPAVVPTAPAPSDAPAPTKSEPTPPPSTSTPTPPGPTETDYEVTLTLAPEPAAYQRKASISFRPSGDEPAGNVLTVVLTFVGAQIDGAETVVFFRDELTPDWTCDAPGFNQPVRTMTCSRTQSGMTVPPLDLSSFGCNPTLSATLTVSHNEGTSNTSTATAETYPNPPAGASCQDPTIPVSGG